ncbi:alpha-ketoglutarate-dependent dioxygenase alkB-like protein [Aureococcus anophagefferens]|nr:alpha-ketoglutarate-dependent dioxygenase alkB-like protein [Aureococcus anophagefferens]
MDKIVIKKRAAGSSGAASSSAGSSATPRAAAAIRTAPCPICAATVDVGLMGHHIDSNCVEFCGPAKKKARASSSPDAPVVYTIGHATFDAAAVFGALSSAGVGTLVDVRSSPNSVTRYTNCHREGLATALVARGVRVVHLRADGEAEAHPRPLAALRAARHEALAGQYTVANFLSEAEEASLLAFLDGEPGHPFVRRDFNGPARGKAWGVRTDLKRRTFAEPARAMPDIFAPLVRRMRTIPELRSFRPNEANALDYRRSEGHYLGAHCDDRQLSGPILIQSGSVRFDYRHGITNADFHADRRVSITFRMNKHPGHRV